MNEVNIDEDDFISYNDNSNPNSNSEDKMLDDSNDNRYNEYSKYNEYGEHDRGYYYHDKRYERKTFPMMNPIISLVTV